MKKAGGQPVPFGRRGTPQTRTSSFNQGPGLSLAIDSRKPNSTAATNNGPQSKSVSKPKTVVNAPAVKILNKGSNAPLKSSEFNRMVYGDLTCVPPMPKSMVKIFLSSTFSDMREERNILAREGFPKLRDYCSKQSLDFQVVDMRWGITDECQNDHSVEKLCLLEVQNSQKSSWGPNFVVLSGDRYGFRPIPTEIEVLEFEILKAAAASLKLGNSNLLDEWYKLDENMVPCQYILQPIRSKFSFFADFSPGCDELRNKATSDWWKTFEALQGVLRASADEAYKKKKLTSDQRHSYFLSVTECEIQEGIMKPQDVNDHCLRYKRVFTGLQGPALSEENATRFIDTEKTATGGVEINDTVLGLKNQLTTKISKKLSSNNMKTYTVPWVSGGVNSKDHKQYLEQFCEKFVEDCQRLIQKALADRQNRKLAANYYSDYEETVHHLNFCLSKCESFCGQEKVLDAAKAYILDDNARTPLVIHANSGLGKTSIMAMIMKKTPEWLKNESHTKLIRFLGTTPKSNNIQNVLFSVLGQLADATGKIISPLEYRTMKNLLECFPRYLKQFASTAKEPVIILLDSLDQLSPSHNAYAMKWLTLRLPQYVKLIVSTLPEEHGILDTLQKLLPNKECFVEVPALAESTAKLITNTYLKKDKRVVTESQMKLLLSVFKDAPSPLFLKLLLDEAKTWNSYTAITDIKLAPTVKTAINKLFEGLEKKFGVELVSHALGYITVGLDGLIAFELEDVLSIDDVVLNDVYRYHDPPVPGIVRIPPLLWARIWHDIKEYLVERLSYGKSTLNWYHRQFWETASERYTGPGKVEQLHKNLTDLYLQDTGVCRTITLVHRKNLVVTNANRMVTLQPYNADNQRKLACLTFHAIRANPALDLEVSKSKIYCNFKYLCTRTAAFSLTSTIESLEDFLEKKPDEEVSMLKSFLDHSKDDLSSPTRFAFCLLAYIKPKENHYSLMSLKEQAKNYLQSMSGSLLLPEFPCLTQRNDSSAQEASVNGISSILGVSKSMALLKTDIEDNDTEDMKSSFAAFNTISQDLQQVDFPEQTSSTKKTFISISDKAVVFGTKSGILTFDLKKSESKESSYTDLVPTKKEKLSDPLGYSSDKWTKSAAVTFKSCIAIINVKKMTLVTQFVVKPATAVIERTFLTSDEEPQLVGVGKMGQTNPQEPETPWFVCLFQKGSLAPVKMLETHAHLDEGNATFVANEEWFVVAAKQTEGDENFPVQLMRYKMDPFSLEASVAFSSEITKVHGSPSLAEAAVLCQDGTVSLVDIQNGSFKVNVKLINPVTQFGMFWEQSIGLLGSSSGQITLYDFESNKSLGMFSAHAHPIEEIEVLDEQCGTLSSNLEFKLWNMQTLIEETKLESLNDSPADMTPSLLDQMYVASIAVSMNGKELLLCTSDGHLRIWDFYTQQLLREFPLGITGDLMTVLHEDTVVMLDKTLKMMQLVHIETGTVVMPSSELPKDAVHMVVSKDKQSIFVISTPKQDHAQIAVVNVNLRKIAKTIVIKKSFTYESLDGVLSANERYLVIRAGINDAEYESVKAMWKKGGFGEQSHRYKFLALDLSQANGALMPCYRQLSKIPTLGVNVRPYTGNMMLISTRRWIVFWDIPTGKCDQKQNKKIAMLYRPQWLGQDCKGTSIFSGAPNGKFIAVGSEDGYLFVYDAESGVPVGGTKPESRHKAAVTDIAISPDSKWVASSCKSCMLKMWDSRTGKECFSVRLDALVQSMTFSPDSKRLVLYTGSQTTRVCVFAVHVG